MIEKKLMNILEFNIILDNLSEYAVSEKTKKEIKDICPSSDTLEVKKLQALTSEAYLVNYKYMLNPIVQFDDVTDILNKAKAGATLQMGELLKVARIIRSSRIAKKDISGTGEDIVFLREVIAPIFVDSALEKSITDSIAGEFEMKDDASELLRSLRRKILSTNNKLKDKLASYTRSNDVSKYLQDNLVTIRQGRFVLPVKSESRSQVPGLIHDQSASGATVFIEPFPIVELNNELKFLQMEEVREIDRILSVLSEGVSNSYNYLNMCQMQCIMLDIIFAKCSYSVSFKGIAPIINSKGYINIINARHPLIPKERVVPVTVTVGKDYKLLIVTGPNTGGKTVCLKTTGLCCLMASMGLWLPCDDGSEISVFDAIYCDLGDEQSIAQSLSTFSAHIVNIVKITDNITPRSLVLMDELGSGTDPIEGAALSVAIIKYIELVGAVGVITTHFSELKEYALVSKNLKNACMQFDEATLRPTYKIMIGIPGVSNALKIAGTLGLNDFILKEARNNIHEDKIQFEEILSSAEKAKYEAQKEADEYRELKVAAERDRQMLINERSKLDEKLERINSNAKAETKRVINNMLEQADEIIAEIKEKMRSADEISLREVRQLRNRLEDIKVHNYDAPAPVYENLDESNIFIGQKIIIKSLRAEGKLLTLPDKKGLVSVSIGNLKTNVNLSDLAKSISFENKKVERKTLLTDKHEQSEPSIEEIKVMGLTVAEAIEVIEPFILSSMGTNKILRIVHGKGTGALGKGVQMYLRTSPMVASYRYGRYGEGDNGVTIAEIK